MGISGEMAEHLGQLPPLVDHRDETRLTLEKFLEENAMAHDSEALPSHLLGRGHGAEARPRASFQRFHWEGAGGVHSGRTISFRGVCPQLLPGELRRLRLPAPKFFIQNEFHHGLCIFLYPCLDCDQLGGGGAGEFCRIHQMSSSPGVENISFTCSGLQR